MSFVKYKFGAFRKQIRQLLKRRSDLKERITYHKTKSNYHLDKIKIIKSETLISVEKELDKYLAMAGNTLDKKSKDKVFKGVYTQ